MWKLEFLKLEIKFENQIFLNYLKMGVLKKLNLRIGILKNYLKMEIWKLNLRKGNFEELFENWIFENLIWKELGFRKFIWRWHFKN